MTTTRLAVAGLTPLSTCDWPGQLVATVFLQGCPLACTYCHNPSLIDARVPGSVEWASVLDLLARRRGLLDGVVFSGGEPTRQLALRAAMLEVRELGYGVGLHTAGVYPSRLEQVLPLVDWVGLDIKCVPRLYPAQTGVNAWGKAFASLRLVQRAGVAMQVRTTVDPTVQTPDDVLELTSLLATLGVDEHVLQQVRPDGTTAAYQEALHAGQPL
ncbi:anaerobic ribonucleoside-triphosphate reductase activating protein [Cellulomonas sp. URHD0024]|uniref:anaerobic ribonucleoside-triphosphate reductase activating protein n=1 Tax=Cellulomonas sp. URHD0024 TaxID=1302620 RepID=UPI00040510C5|nr:anaerobic ribonucleoside-triphosphate reductase activating protein [Cellulomonas sp. URHD0024]